MTDDSSLPSIPELWQFHMHLENQGSCGNTKLMNIMKIILNSRSRITFHQLLLNWEISVVEVDESIVSLKFLKANDNFLTPIELLETQLKHWFSTILRIEAHVKFRESSFEGLSTFLWPEL